MPQDFTVTIATPLLLTVTGDLNSAGEVVCDLRPSAMAAGSGALIAADNLSDLDDPAEALTNLGGTATGVAVFTAANTPAAQAAIGAGEAGSAVFIAATPADARTALEATATGSALFTAEDAAAARDALDVSNVVPLVVYLTDVISANAVVVAVVAPFDCEIVGADLWASATIAAGNLTATLAINGVAVTNGVMTLNAGATSGTLGPCTPTANNEAVARQGVIRVTVGGGNTAAGRGTVTVYVQPALIA